MLFHPDYRLDLYDLVQNYNEKPGVMPNFYVEGVRFHTPLQVGLNDEINEAIRKHPLAEQAEFVYNFVCAWLHAKSHPHEAGSIAKELVDLYLFTEKPARFKPLTFDQKENNQGLFILTCHTIYQKKQHELFQVIANAVEILLFHKAIREAGLVFKDFFEDYDIQITTSE